jgi:hypothetical protein
MGCRRFALTLATAATVACATTLRPVLRPADDARLTVAGEAILPQATASGPGRAEVGGLSGAYYDVESGTLYAVSDDRDRPRLLTLDVRLTPEISLVPREGVTLQFPYRQRRTLDAEGLAAGPRGRVFVSSEGDPANPQEPVPGIYEYTRGGRFIRSLPMPSAYVRSSQTSGMRPNGSLEALSTSPGGARLFTATESSLRQDGPEANFDHGALIRVLVYNLRSLSTPPREYAYRTDPIERQPGFSNPRAEAGVAEVLALSETDLLFLERGFIADASAKPLRSATTIRIYRATINEAAEVTGRTSLIETPPAEVLRKTLVFDGADAAVALSDRLRSLENFEAMTFGPRLPDGSPTLLLLSDDNFSARQVTALLVLRWATP